MIIVLCGRVLSESAATTHVSVVRALKLAGTLPEKKLSRMERYWADDMTLMLSGMVPLKLLSPTFRYLMFRRQAGKHRFGSIHSVLYRLL